MKNYYKLIAALLLALPLLMNEAIAQPPPPPTGPPCWPPPCIPVDGGITYFTFAALLLGTIALFYSNRKKLAAEKVN